MQRAMSLRLLMPHHCSDISSQIGEQIAHPEDTRNFSSMPEEPHASRKRYVSTGIFKDF